MAAWAYLSTAVAMFTLMIIVLLKAHRELLLVERVTSAAVIRSLARNALAGFLLAISYLSSAAFLERVTSVPSSGRFPWEVLAVAPLTMLATVKALVSRLFLRLAKRPGAKDVRRGKR